MNTTLEAMEMTDLDGLADRLHLAKDTLQRFWTELPYVRIPSSKGVDARGARFLVGDVIEYLVKNNGVNYGNICVQNEGWPEVQSQSLSQLQANSVPVGVCDKTRSKKVAGRRNQKRRTMPAADDPHGLRPVRK